MQLLHSGANTISITGGMGSLKSNWFFLHPWHGRKPNSMTVSCMVRRSLDEEWWNEPVELNLVIILWITDLVGRQYTWVVRTKNLWNTAHWDRSRKQLWGSSSKGQKLLMDLKRFLLKLERQKINTESLNTQEVYLLITLIYTWFHYSHWELLLKGNNVPQSSLLHRWYHMDWAPELSSPRSHSTDWNQPTSAIVPAKLCF